MNLFTRLLNAGITEQLTAYDRRQTKVFNSCNLAGMLIALLRLAYLSFGSPNHYPGFVLFEIGRASCRERVLVAV